MEEFKLNQNLINILNAEGACKVTAMEKYAKEHNIPILRHNTASLLKSLIRTHKPKLILEIGTAIGYSAINMALKNDISVTTIEKDTEMYKIALDNVKSANLENRIELINDDALEVNESLLGSFDLVFIDAAKAQSIKFFEKYKNCLNEEGIIITDNLLFHDLVTQVIRDRNLRQLVRKIDSFNKFVVEVEGFDTYLYQLGDGMSLSIKRK